MPPPPSGGGGGGIYLQGASLTATQSTIANNHINSPLINGQSVLDISSSAVSLSYDIVANDSANAGTPPITVDTSSSVTVNRTLFVATSSSVALANGPNSGAAGTVNGASTALRATSAGFISPGSPNFNYGLNGNSPAVDQAVGSTATVDRNGNPRVGVPDLGALEFVPPTVSFANLDNPGFDTSQFITVSVVLSSADSTQVTVHYATSNGTAIAGTDYVPVSGTLTFTPGVTSQSFVIPIIPNNTHTGNVRINLALSGPTGIALGSLPNAVATIQGTQPADNLLFISGLFHDLLGRAADGNGISFFSPPLYNAETPLLPAVLLRFVNAQPYYATLAGDPTNGFYVRFLGRKATNDEANFWGNQQAFGGMTDEQVIAQFVGGDEYFMHKGASDNLTWLKAAYLDLLGRPLDANGQTTFLPQVGNSATTREAVVMQLVTSDEYRLNLIQADFQLYLSRPTNSTDRQYWLSQFKGGATDEQVIVGIGGSLEGLLNNGGTNAKLITSLYQKTLHRTPSASELAFHLNALENNANTLFDNPYQLQRFYTAQLILGSPEYASHGTFNLATDLNTLISTVYQKALGRSASSDDLSFWSVQFVGDPNRNADVVAAILSSGEYFNDPHIYP
jgi:hypothetical protein